MVLCITPHQYMDVRPALAEMVRILRPGGELLLIGDLILAEVLQGFVSEHDFNQAKTLLTALPVVPLVGPDVALQSARNFRHLRTLGVTVRKTIDTLIATSCIENGYTLLYSDRDFDPFVEHLGLVSAWPGR